MATIALAQTTSTDDFQANLATAEHLVAEAAARDADLVAFPEVFLFLGSRRRKLEIAEAVDGPTVGRFQEQAARHGLMILLGSIHERNARDPGRAYNTSVLIDANGRVIATYRKLKLFDVELPHVKIRESDSIAPGDAEPPVVDTAIGRIGLTICFDLRFPELYQGLRRRGAEIVFVPSNFTAPTGAAHWEVLLRARAVENQVYVAAPAQFGRHNPKYVSHGHSMLVDPWGRVVTEQAEGVGVSLGAVDLEYLQRVRSELPMGVEARPAPGVESARATG